MTITAVSLAAVGIARADIEADDDVTWQGQKSIRVRIPAATYYYHKQGAAFASIIDKDGNDWLSYKPGVGARSKSGSGGKYRGLPNMGYPEGYCHPGKTVSSSILANSGGDKVSIISESDDGKMKCRWDIYFAHATMTVIKMRAPYWFLYEGTPGGKLNVESDFCVRGDGTKTLLSEKWEGDLSDSGIGGEWLYFADPAVNRSFYIVNHNDDDAIDSYWAMNGEMTVFGFGRKGLNKYIKKTLARFTIGFCDSTDFETVSRAAAASFGKGDN